MQSIGHWKRDNLSLWFLFPLQCNSLWNFLLDPLVWPGMVEELNICFDHPIPMTLPKDQQVIKAFPPYATQEPFAEGIGFRRAIRRFQDFNFASYCHSRESLSICRQLVVVF